MPSRGPLLLLAATPMELAAFLRHTTLHVPPLAPGDSCAHGGLVLAVSGVGPVNAALAAGLLLERHAPRGVILTGIAGSFDTSRHPLGCIRLIAEEIWPEYGIAGARGVHARALKFPQGEIDGEPVWDRLVWDATADARALGLDLSNIPTARGLTVAGVTGTPRRAAAMVRRFTPDLEHMEGFPVALACRRAGVAFVQLRSVSNPVGVRDKRAWDIPAALAALADTGRGMGEKGIFLGG
ncbi:futalosine hydrolase [Megalodesulfovibrio gigas]|uniref:Futalosine hydrolase n=1 Tax=Megalodesulfovibrio gigas (strain ATCC 19364 / DSM 1382 / NCIMB 9332 / VKM B-1759) TaxID=1121448 RepID=T2GEK5_MEGG1|nr:futalosine hydrolase [Megalodesulfovibrio gigas]AGW14357.1 putative futalosine nucleosidase [Megalodesulfovibrio gigas DSM 1382 = ATCC 19364]